MPCVSCAARSLSSCRVSLHKRARAPLGARLYPLPPPPSSHILLAVFSPLQRGGATGADGVAAPVCLQTSAPCGTLPAGAPTGVFLRESRAVVTLQKNADHTAATGNPGNFTLHLWGAGDKVGTFIGARENDDRPSLAVYELEVYVRNATVPGNYVLQATYNTNNAAAPFPAFYQCADVQVL